MIARGFRKKLRFSLLHKNASDFLYILTKIYKTRRTSKSTNGKPRQAREKSPGMALTAARTRQGAIKALHSKKPRRNTKRAQNAPERARGLHAQRERNAPRRMGGQPDDGSRRREPPKTGQPRRSSPRQISRPCHAPPESRGRRDSAPRQPRQESTRRRQREPRTIGAGRAQPARDSPRDDDSRASVYNVDFPAGRAQTAPEPPRDGRSRQADRDSRRQLDAPRAAERARETASPDAWTAGRAERLGHERLGEGERERDYPRQEYSSPAGRAQNQRFPRNLHQRGGVYIHIYSASLCKLHDFQPAPDGIPPRRKPSRTANTHTNRPLSRTKRPPGGFLTRLHRIGGGNTGSTPFQPLVQASDHRSLRRALISVFAPAYAASMTVRF